MFNWKRFPATVCFIICSLHFKYQAICQISWYRYSHYILMIETLFKRRFIFNFSYHHYQFIVLNWNCIVHSVLSRHESVSFKKTKKKKNHKALTWKERKEEKEEKISSSFFVCQFKISYAMSNAVGPSRINLKIFLTSTTHKKMGQLFPRYRR